MRLAACLFLAGSLMWGAQAVFSYAPPSARGVPASLATAQKSIGTLRVLTYNYVSDQEIISLTTPLFPQLRFSVNGPQKLIGLIGERPDMDRFETFLRALDMRRPVIEYSTILMEINRNELKKLGIDWQGFVDQWKITRLRGMSEFLDQISFLLKNGEAKILANPVVISVADEEAVIKVGDRIPYALPVEYGNKTGWQIQYMDAGIQLRIKGHVLSENVVQVHVLTTISNVKQWKATSGGDYPVLSNREVDLKCQIMTGETMMIGGLANNNKRINLNQLPILSDLPWIGGLFRLETVEQEDTEIVFLLMPKIKTL